MKFVALVSGGKDSIYAIHCAQQLHHELIACIHLAAPKTTTTTTDNDNGNDTDKQLEEEEEQEESYMYQSAGSNVVAYQVEQCLQVPCIVVPRTGRSVQTGLLYRRCRRIHHSNNNSNSNTASDDTDHTHTDTHDEVEDLYTAIRLAQDRYPQMEAICHGAILSNYQRHRIEQLVVDINNSRNSNEPSSSSSSTTTAKPLVILSYLWRKNTMPRLLHEMIANGGIQAQIVKTACPPALQAHRHLNTSVEQLLLVQQQQQSSSSKLQKYNHRQYFNLCGEGGEYESFVVNAHAFPHYQLILDETSIQLDIDNPMIGTLHISKYHVSPKPIQQQGTIEQVPGTEDKSNPAQDQSLQRNTPTATTTSDTMTTSSHERQQQQQQRHELYHPTTTIQSSLHPLQQQQQPYMQPPHVRHVNGGLYSISEIMSPQQQTQPPEDPSFLFKTTTTTTTTVKEMIQTEIREIFAVLQSILARCACTAHDIVMVHVYVSDISYFSILNDDYRNFFGVTLPPSRSTIDIGPIVSTTIRNSSNVDVNEECHVMIDCLVQCGSGAYMREVNYSSNNDSKAVVPDDEVVPNNGTTVSTTMTYANAAVQNTFMKLRDVLHVQSISYWAPVCVGPYSQVNTIRGCVHFCAGQIGLYPPTMTLQQPSSWSGQLKQAWKNVANVLDALDACCIPKNLLSGIVFVSDRVFHFNTTGTINDDGSDNVDNEWTQLCYICTEQMVCNGGIIPGAIDEIVVDPRQFNNDNYDDDEYEDEETRIEMEKNRIHDDDDDDDDTNDNGDSLPCPVLVVSIPQMPVGALCEIEVVAASRRATNALQIQDYDTHNINSNSNHHRSTAISLTTVSITTSEQQPIERRYQLDWDTGHDFHDFNNSKVLRMKDETTTTKAVVPSATLLQPQQSHDDATTATTPARTSDVAIHSYFRCLGSRTTSSALVIASFTDGITSFGQQQKEEEVAAGLVDPYSVLNSMIVALKTQSHYDYGNMLHLRLYYINTSMDGTYIRQVLHSVLHESFSTTPDMIPATTVIPVTDMGIIINASKKLSPKIHTTINPFFAIQALSMDPIRTEQSVWIHEGR